MKIKKSSAVFRCWKWLHTGPFASGSMRASFERKIESASTCSVFKDFSLYGLSTLMVLIIFLIVMCLMMTAGNAIAIIILVIGFLFGYGPNRVVERLIESDQRDGFLLVIVFFPLMLILPAPAIDGKRDEIPGLRELNLPRVFGIPIYPIYLLLGIAMAVLVYIITLGTIDFFSSLATRPEELETLGYLAIVIGGVLGFFGLLALWKSSFGLLARTYIKDRLKGLCRKIEFVDE